MKKTLHKRKHGGKLRKLTPDDRTARDQHNKRTKRADKLFIKQKVVPSDKR